MKKGSVLEEDSYVFSLEEAEELKQKIINLEYAEKQLELQKELVKNLELKETLLEENVQRYQEYSKNLEEINNNNQLIIDKYMKKESLSTFKMTGYFVLGFSLAYGSIYMASRLN